MKNPLDGPQPETEPGIASAEDGLVFLDGPDGVAMTMTADAAARTGQSLIDAAAVAERQKAESNG
ncbi:MAG: hypothetical protein Q7T68_02250 [Sphingopyxis sp.]|nr:hypothetical protein [Sphingopyxis sp.]